MDKDVHVSTFVHLSATDIGCLLMTCRSAQYAVANMPEMSGAAVVSCWLSCAKYSLGILPVVMAARDL